MFSVLLFFESNVTGESYQSILTDWLLPQLLNVDKFEEEKLTRQQDSALPHWARDVREWLDITFRERWMGQSGSTAWPTRSPDLTPKDFWSSGDVKRTMYNKHLIESLETLKVKIRAEIREISAEPRPAVIVDFRHRLHRFRENKGSHAELYMCLIYAFCL